MQTPAAPAAPAVARAFAWTGGALFLASLLYCFLTYETGMGAMGTIGTMGAGGAAGRIVWPVAVDVLLFTMFALHHSVFARERARALMRRLVPQGLERSVYVWIASLMLAGVCALWRPVPGTVWQAGGVAVWCLRAVQVAGVWLTIRSAAAIDVFELAGIRQGAPGATPSEFKTTGPYGRMRHPIYSGWLAIVFAEPTMTATRLVFAVVSGVYLLIAIPLEERSLRATTGGAYERYERAVPWKLIPGVF